MDHWTRGMGRALVYALLPWALALPAQAAVNGGVALKGSMESICYVVVTQTVTNVDIVKGNSGLTIGSVGEKCNRGNGFTITLSSANAGALVSEGGARAPYTVQYDNSGTRSLSSPVTLTRTSAKKTVSTKSFKVSLPAKPQALAGSYGDTITVSIAAR